MHRLLERLAGHTGRLEGLLRELKALEIIYELGLLQEPAYVFKHAVIQDVAYNSLLRERRRELHRGVGEAIEELYADRLGEHYEELAHHFVNGEAWDKALEYLVRSGDRARAGFANQAALDFYEKALEAARHVSPPPSPLRLAAVHQGRGEVWRLVARYDESIAEFERVLELARVAGDRHAEGEALVELALSHWLTFSTPRVPAAKRYAEEALAMAEETGDERVLARAMSYLGLIAQVGGDLTDGDRKLARSLEIAERRGLPQMVAQNLVWLGAHANWRGEFHAALPFVRRAEEVAASHHDGFNELFAVAFICLPQIALGEFGEAQGTIERGLRRARELQNGFIEGRLLNTLGWFHQELGDFRRALELDREAAEVGRRIKNPNVEVSSLINLGLDHLHLGDVDRAVALWEETQVRVDKHAFGAHRWRWSNHLAAYLAEGLLARGDTGRAGAQADIAVMQARATGARKYEGRALAVRGEIALRAKDWAAARQDLVAALGIARAIDYPALVWQVARLLARAAAGADRMDEARAAAAEARATIEHLAARAPDAALRASFLGWPCVQAALEEAERLGRA
jgi:tetratricopeptide (TPR) repeat protein